MLIISARANPVIFPRITHLISNRMDILIVGKTQGDYYLFSELLKDNSEIETIPHIALYDVKKKTWTKFYEDEAIIDFMPSLKINYNYDKLKDMNNIRLFNYIRLYSSAALDLV